MKKLFKNIMFFSLLIAPILYALNYITDNGMRKSKKHNYSEWNDIFGSKINADVLVMGTSRADRMVSPKILDTILHMYSYNIGMDGWHFHMQYARFKIYLQHNIKPKFIIQNIDFHLFEENNELNDREQFIPYLDDTNIKQITNQYLGKFTFPEMYFPFFKYNQHMVLIKEGIKSYFNNETNSEDYKGYNPCMCTWDSSFNNFKKANPNGIKAKILEQAVIEIEAYLHFCNKNNIKIFFEFAPVYYEEMQMEKSANQVKEAINRLSEKYKIIVLDYSHDTLCYNKKYFYNSQHLNSIGSEIFTTHLANDIESIIHPKNNEQIAVKYRLD